MLDDGRSWILIAAALGAAARVATGSRGVVRRRNAGADDDALEPVAPFRYWTGRCQRCELEAAVHIGSIFNRELVCSTCRAEEEQHPLAEEARRLESQAIRLRGDFDYPGPGLPRSLRAAALRRAAEQGSRGVVRSGRSGDAGVHVARAGDLAYYVSRFSGILSVRVLNVYPEPRPIPGLGARLSLDVVVTSRKGPRAYPFFGQELHELPSDDVVPKKVGKLGRRGFRSHVTVTTPYRWATNI